VSSEAVCQPKINVPVGTSCMWRWYESN